MMAASLFLRSRLALQYVVNLPSCELWVLEEDIKDYLERVCMRRRSFLLVDLVGVFGIGIKIDDSIASEASRESRDTDLIAA
jgi:hypothetical protein